MQSLNQELKALIGRRLEQGNPRDILAIASAICATETPQAPTADTVQAARYQIIDDEQALDTSTGLIWTRKRVAKDRLKWDEAVSACEKLNIGGHEWRLPTIRELLTLVDYDRYDPAIDTDIFECESAWYWTSTPAASSPGDAWGVYFSNGGAYWSYRAYGGFVRAVRPGQ